MGHTGHKEKIKTLSQLVKITDRLKKQGKRIILCTGVFDFLHIGHINYLQEAKKLGDVIVVAIVDDKFVKKGPNKPIFKQNIRMAWLAALEEVDYVILNGGPGPHEAMRKIKPNFYAKGESDKKNLTDPKSGIAKDKKTMDSIGKLVFTKELPVHSGDIFKKIYEIYKKNYEN